MAIILHDIIQGTPEWMALRAGNPGAASISKIITSTGQISKQREDYLYQLAGEQITGQCEETFQSIHMANGTEREATARALFEMIYDTEVVQAGIIYKDEWRLFHASPDGLVSDDAGLELKCPMLKTQTRYLLDGKLPTDYFGQVQMSMFVSERPMWYFMSYYAGMPPFILKVERDEEYIAKMAKALDDFCADLQNVVKKLRSML